MAQRAEVIVYTISTNLSGAGHHGDKVLERIADATGGRAYVPFQITEVANAFAAIQEELRSQYAQSRINLPTSPPTATIAASTTPRPWVKRPAVRSRRGYYAPSQ